MTSEEAWQNLRAAVKGIGPNEATVNWEGHALLYADARVREALADYTMEKLQQEALETGTLFGAPISDLQAIWHLTRELGIPIDKLRERVEAILKGGTPNE